MVIVRGALAAPLVLALPFAPLAADQVIE